MNYSESVLHKQNIINLCREFCMPEDKVKPMYTKIVSEMEKDAEEYDPFEAYRRTRELLKKERAP